MLEVPDIPDECGFVEGPLGHARDEIEDVEGQGPGKGEGEQGEEAQHPSVFTLGHGPTQPFVQQIHGRAEPSNLRTGEQ